MERRTAALILIAATAGCAENGAPTEPPDPANVAVEVGSQGLVQRIELSPATPAPGDTLIIRSTVTNEGAARTVAARTCGMDVQGIALTPLGPTCAAWSIEAELETGVSVIETVGGIVASAPGTHRVRVRHLLDPERWVEFDLRVGS